MALNTSKCNHLMPLHFKGLSSDVCMCRERSEPGKDFRGSQSSTSRRGRGVTRGNFTPGSDGGFDRFGKREFERRSGSDKTYGCLLVSFRSAFHLWHMLFIIFYQKLSVVLHAVCFTAWSELFHSEALSSSGPMWAPGL